MKQFFSNLAMITMTLTVLLLFSGCSEIAKSRVYDDRLQIQKEEHLQLETQKLEIDPTKHTLLLGFDGVSPASIKKNLDLTSNYFAEFPIQTWESQLGWTSVIYGNAIRTGSSIFDLIKKNDLASKTSAITAWAGFEGVFRSDILIDKWYDFDLQTNDFYDIKANTTFKEIAPKMVMQYEKAKSDVSANYSLVFEYDGFADEAGHSQFNDKSALVLDIIKYYHSIYDYYVKNLDSEEWLIIAITDHGRDINSFDHSYDDYTNRVSWVLSNNNLGEILDRHFINLYDIKTAILKFMMLQ